MNTELQKQCNIPLQYFQNQADWNPGTENTPQWRKIPIFASSYQEGSGLLSNDAQLGW